MAGARGSVWRELGTLFEAGSSSGLTDDQLLERFAARRAEAAEAANAAEAAFAALIHRHGPMVLGACRQMLDDPRDAEDAFQATFLVLARRAGSVRPGGNVGRWLRGVARRVASRARAEALSRRLREGVLPVEPASDPSAEARRADAREAFDLEMSRLPAKYRSAIESCYIDGLTIIEASRRLGCPAGTVAARLARGRALLRSGLVRRGMAPAVIAALASLTIAPRGARASESLVHTTARAAARYAAGRTALAEAVSPSVASLVEGVLTTMLLTKSKILAGFVAALAVVLGTGVWARQKSGEAPPRAEAGPQQPAEKAPVVLLARAEPAEEQAVDKTPYPIEISPEKVYEYPELEIKVRDFELKSGPVAVIPIACSQGITGLVVIGRGTFRYTPPGAKVIEGEFRAAMLRFNPADLASIVRLEEGKKVTDRGAFELSRNVIDAVFGHCWHSGKQALLPTVGNISAVLYSKEHGDLLISDDGQKPVVHNFSTRKTLYQKK
jgi:RNA polymerase sigma factor (sigma-70 family)